MRFHFKQIWVDEDVVDEPMARRIIGKLPGAKVVVGDFSEQSRGLDLSADPITRGKGILRLTRRKGAFVKPCPGTPEYVCCGLQILHIGQGCPMDCRYCALQVYFNRPVIEIFVNMRDMLDSLNSHITESSVRFHRICTGEFTDSLALDPLTGLASELIDFFSRTQNACLEIKTKTDFIDPLLDLDPRGRVVISFSVNSSTISRTEEIRAAPLERRLSAALKAQHKGYKIGFHFDPIIPVAGWENDYCATVDNIFHRVDPAAVAWISLGVLRFVPALKEVARMRFGVIPYFHDGFSRGLDGKSRLFVERRIQIYRTLADRIRRYSPETAIYLCMESPLVWQRSLDMRMESDEDLATYLDNAVDSSRRP